VSHRGSQTGPQARLGSPILGPLSSTEEHRQRDPDQDSDDEDDDHQLHEREPSLVARVDPALSCLHLLILQAYPSVAALVGLKSKGAAPKAAPFHTCRGSAYHFD
jgi:hypothetical protein